MENRSTPIAASEAAQAIYNVETAGGVKPLPQLLAEILQSILETSGLE